jgi:hypothetical protein
MQGLFEFDRSEPGTFYFPVTEGVDLSLFVVSTPEADFAVNELYDEAVRNGRDGETLVVSWDGAALAVECLPDPLDGSVGPGFGLEVERVCFTLPFYGRVCVWVAR